MAACNAAPYSREDPTVLAARSSAPNTLMVLQGQYQDSIATKSYRLRPDLKFDPQRYQQQPGHYLNESKFSAGKHFKATPVSFGGFDEFAAKLTHAASYPSCLLIRGALADGANPEWANRRIHHRDGQAAPSFVPANRNWILTDADDVPAPDGLDPIKDPEEAAQHVIETYYPECFHSASFWWSLTSSAGLMRRDTIRMRLGFVLDRPVSDAECKTLMPGKPSADPALYNPVQPHYIAAPVFDGVPDPIHRRMGVWKGESDIVELPATIAAPKRERVKGGSTAGLRGAKGFEGFLALMGDGDGLEGFHGPITSAVSAYIGIHGIGNTDTEALKNRIRQAIDAAPANPGRDADFSRYSSDFFLDDYIQWVVDRERSKPDVPVAYPEHGGTVDEATATITTALDELVAEAHAWPEKLATAKAQHKAWEARQADCGEFDFSFTDPEPKLPATPGLGIDATPGAGKTELAIERAVKPMLAQGPVIMAAPDHDLASEMVRRIESAGLQAAQIYGRDQELPDGTQVCHYADVAKLLGIEGFSIKRSLCERKPADEALPTVYCPHHPDNIERVGPPCRYLLQFQERNAQRVHVCTHAHLTESRNRVPLPTSPSLVVVDENPTGSLLVGANATTDRTDFPADALARPYTLTRPTKSGRETLVNESAELSDLLGRIRRALETPDISPETLRNAGINHAWLAQAAGHIWTHTRAEDIAAIIPGMPKDGMLSLIEQHASGTKKTERTLLRLIARMLDVLAEVIDLDVDEIRPIERFEKEGSRWLRLVRSKPLRTDEEPLLLLDGSADHELMTALVPQVQRWIDAKIDTPQATIRQVVDRRVSMTALCPDADFARPKDLTTAQNNRAKIARTLEVEALKGQPVACISYKAVCDPKSEIALQNEHTRLAELGVSFGWFGKMRGQNAWSDCDVLYVIGRICPKVHDLERQARAIFWKDARSLERLTGPTELPKRRVGLRIRDGRSQAVQDEYHPCLLTDRVLRQICAAELTQAVHRARCVRRPCEVTLATSAPCDVTVTEASTWQTVIPSRFDVAVARSFMSGFLPLSPAELARLHPDLWVSADAAKDELKRLKSEKGDSPIDTLYGVSPFSELGGILLRYWKEGTGQRGLAAHVRRGVSVFEINNLLDGQLTHIAVNGAKRVPAHEFRWDTDGETAWREAAE